MEKGSHNSIGLIAAACIVSVGLLGIGKASISKYFRFQNQIIVKGLSERIVKSDIAKIQIVIKNEAPTLAALSTMRLANRERTIEVIKQCGISEQEITVDVDTYVERSKDKVYMQGNDTIFIKTKDFEKVETLKTMVTELSSKDMMVSFRCEYVITDFQALKLDMLDEAARNAKQGAIAAVKPYGRQITDLAYLSQGGIVILGENASADRNYDYSSENSVNKRVRLVVTAGFYHK